MNPFKQLIGARNQARGISEERAEKKAAQVCELLVAEGITDEDATGVIARILTRHYTGERPVYEVIVDHPVSALWRLTPTPGDSQQLRLGYWGFNSEREARARRISEQLSEI